MLGRHADAFFSKQARERVLANQPNGEAQSIAYPDRELAGTGQVTTVSGYYEMPGPQNVLAGNSMMPGMQGDAMPGMGDSGMMPGMNGFGPTLPGMGALDTGKLVKWGIIAGVGIVGYNLWSKRKATKKKAKRSSRRRSAGRRKRSWA